MTVKIRHFQTLLILGLMITLFIGCDNDFIELDSDLVNEEVATNFNLDSLEYDVLSYTLPLGPVQSNGLPTNHIGIYDGPTFGPSNYDFVSQIAPTFYSPDFGDNPSIDSVTLYIPFYSILDGNDENGNPEYTVDSIYGNDPIKLTLFENEYFLREFDPNGDFTESQRYYTNKSASETESISDDLLEGPSILEATTIEISTEPIYLTVESEDEDQEIDTSQTLAPGIYLKLPIEYWEDKILAREDTPVLENENAFLNYFRGIYFKTEAINNSGALIGINLATTLSTITMYYERDSDEVPEEGEEPEREKANYVFNFRGQQVNFIENQFNEPIPVGDQENGDASLYLKGGEGSVAGIELFKGETPDGESVFDAFKREFAEYDENGDFVEYKRLINEVNLEIYVDQSKVQGEEPERVYLYDMDNGIPLVDYSFDIVISTLPRLSISSHLGILDREDDDPEGDGVKYVVKITRHILNLIENDSTNVKLGLAVASNVNLEVGSPQGDVQAIENSAEMVPLSSITSPRGTVLHGNASQDPVKRLRLRVFYTCLEDIEDCGSN